MPDRPVPLTVLLKLSRLRGPAGVLGLVFVLGSLFVLTPALLVASRNFTQSYERYDYDAIRDHGTVATAHIISITPVLNTTINGEHPRVISYTYPSPAGNVADQFQTLELAKLGGLQAGDTIRIRALNQQSIIPSLRPFSFPFGYFFILPGVFLLVGLPFFLWGFLPAWRAYQLYRHGIVRKATVTGISSRVISTSRHSQQSVLVVSYDYASLTGQKLAGESPTDDLLLVREKKFGDAVDIFVSDTDETKSCLVPRLDALKHNWQL
ncbi:hypothetical protein [Hymenobacter cheonanensis]|uniref:hypothetical protein n=1 Tax=Hymenobacter sp. CA2-7 TaxID=3063993 RepID=UPI0027143902|nr:hypothetical protein [Hymenobacter sp. CA2-7]MDO7887121.1 hypothetical protein [Hymenobacter sp. CA2-7]